MRQPGVLFGVLLAGLTGCHPVVDPPAMPEGAGIHVTSNLFQEVTSRLKLDFIHDSGARGAYFMPEQMGSGAALFDFDNDGRLDAYLIQCGGPGSGSPNQLFHQEPDGSFKNASAGSGLDILGLGMGATAGDVNNDGWTDMLVTEYGATRLFLNSGSGTFREVTAECGVENARWATSAAFFDYDRDGWLDLAVGNYVDYNPTHKCHDAGGALEYCGPQNFSGTTARLFRNLGSGSGPGLVRFEEVTLVSGLARAPGPALGVLCADFDGDRWPDIFLADDGAPNRLWINQRDGRFVEDAARRGVALNGMGAVAGNMGVAAGDVDRDGLWDLFVTHLSEEQHALWAQEPRGMFMDRTSAFGLANPAWRGTGFGTVLADFDLDGWLDLALVNGLIRRGQNQGPSVKGLAPFWIPYAQRPQLFLNDRSGRMREVSKANPEFCGDAMVGRGLAVGDLDNDGKLDLLTTGTGGPARVFRNVAPGGGHWLTIRAVDPALGGRDAYGAEVWVRAGKQAWWRLVQPASSYLVSQDPRAHFGLGDTASVEGIRVLWPDGTEEQFEGGSVDRFLVLRKGGGRMP